MHRFFITTLLWILVHSSLANAAIRVAILTPAGSAAGHISALLESTFGSNTDVQLVERQQFAALLQEQQLADCFGAEQTSTRLKLGRLINADLLVILREEPKPVRHLQIVVFEAHQGLRLLVEPALLTNDITADTSRIRQRVEAAMHKLREGITTIVAVPDFACDDLTREYADGGNGFAPLIEQSLLNRKGVVVVEITEAQAIARELAIGGNLGIQRPLPLILLGSYRDQDVIRHRTLGIHMSLKQGDATLGDVSAEQIDPERPAQILLELTQKLFGKVLARPVDAPDAEADARQLYERGSTFVNASDYRRGLSLCDASLLMQANPRANREAAFAIQQICIDERNRSLADSSVGAKRVVDLYQFPEAVQPLRDEGLAHLQQYMKAEKLVYLDPENRIVSMYRATTSPARFAEMLQAVAAWKYQAKVQDDTFRYALDLNWAVMPIEKRYALAERLAEFAQRESDVTFLGKLFSPASGEAPPLQMHDALRDLASSDNPFARSASSKLQHRPESSVALPNGPVATSTAEVTVKLVPIDLGLHPVLGFTPAGMQFDLVWGEADHNTPAIVFALAKRGGLKKLCQSIPESRPLFDGHYVWSTGDGSAGPEVIIVDPSTGDRWSIAPADGLPNEQISGFAAAALAPGRICAAIAIGSRPQVRSYIALLCIDPTGDKNFILLHEEKLSATTPGIHRLDPQIAFVPRSAELLSPVALDPSVKAIVGFTGGFSWRTVTFPDADSIQTGRGVTVAVDTGLWGTSVHMGKVYDTRSAAGESAANLLCSSVGGQKPKIVNSAAVSGPLAFTDRGVFCFCAANDSLYLAASADQPFHRFNTIVGSPLVRVAHNTLCLSNRFGLLLLSESSLSQFQDNAAEALQVIAKN